MESIKIQRSYHDTNGYGDADEEKCGDRYGHGAGAGPKSGRGDSNGNGVGQGSGLGDGDGYPAMDGFGDGHGSGSGSWDGQGVGGGGENLEWPNLLTIFSLSVDPDCVNVVLRKFRTEDG